MFGKLAIIEDLALINSVSHGMICKHSVLLVSCVTAWSDILLFFFIAATYLSGF